MKKIEINDREVFERYHVNSIINSEYQFSTLFIWQHAYNFEYEVWNDCLIVYGTQRNGDTQVYFPIGKVTIWIPTLVISSIFLVILTKMLISDLYQNQ